MSRNNIRNWHLYILRLEDGKYYVGITTKTPEQRMKEHQSKIRGAYWTAMHVPIEVIYSEDLGVINESKAKRRENRATRECMKLRGINNVRGGDLTNTSDYIVRFGRVYDRFEWDAVTLILLLMLLVAYLLIDNYFL